MEGENDFGEIRVFHWNLLQNYSAEFATSTSLGQILGRNGMKTIMHSRPLT